ncbi:MAG: EpsG family protein [Thermoguttaceae bacterium]|nr:EpsG family protein [Thermoguttaceae bacterium]
MLGYLLILGVAFFFGANSYKVGQNSQYKKFYIILVFGSALAFAVLRGYDVATDYMNRVVQMKLIFPMSFEEVVRYATRYQKGEYIYIFYLWTVSRVVESPWLLNSLMDVFIISTFAWFFHRYSKDVTITSLFFMAFTFSSILNITRQHIAVAVGLIALHLTWDKQPFKALILLLISSLIHASSILILGFWGFNFWWKRMTRKHVVLCLIGAFVFFTTFELCLEKFFLFFPQYQYATSGWAAEQKEFSFLWLALYSVLFGAIFILMPKQGLQDTSKFVVVSFIIYAVLGLLSSKMVFVARMQPYFSWGFAMIIPEILSWWHTDERIKAPLALYFKVGLASWAVLMFQQNGHNILPYTFIWDY